MSEPLDSEERKRRDKIRMAKWFVALRFHLCLPRGVRVARFRAGGEVERWTEARRWRSGSAQAEETRGAAVRRQRRAEEQRHFLVKYDFLW
jgi:hypothetical protein